MLDLAAGRPSGRPIRAESATTGGRGASPITLRCEMLTDVGKHSIDLDVCPCCGYRTGYATCPVCSWTSDGPADADPDVVRGGPNGTLSLSHARLNFQLYGTSNPWHGGDGVPRWEEPN